MSLEIRNTLGSYYVPTGLDCEYIAKSWHESAPLRATGNITIRDLMLAGY